jgi:hypothetical protein
MISVPLRIVLFAALLAVVFAGAAVAGGAIDPAAPGKSDDPAAGHADDGGHGEARPVRGLAVAEDGLRIVVDEPELARGKRTELTFRVVDDAGRTVNDFDVEHERRMHMIVVRRDLTGFQHLHPEQGADGSWTAQVKLDEAGSYRLFADFTRTGEPYTLASDLRVDGPAELQALPPVKAAAVAGGGYDVRLDTRGDELRFEVSSRGRPVATEPYLGAGGHLVALREGDLAFLHVHPTDEDATAFEATFPTAGRYRLFLQFKYEGRVRTAAFTHEVAP